MAAPEETMLTVDPETPWTGECINLRPAGGLTDA